MSLGRTLCTSPTMPRSATPKIGASSEVSQAQSRASRAEANELSVRLELQADCYAGVWGSSAQDRGLIEPGDLEEGLAAAESIGDDRLQEQSGGDVQPDTWTHGSSAARQRWFRAGFDSGRVGACDTFAASASDLGL